MRTGGSRGGLRRVLAGFGDRTWGGAVALLLVLAFVGLLVTWRGQPAHHDATFVRAHSQTNPGAPRASADASASVSAAPSASASVVTSSPSGRRSAGSGGSRTSGSGGSGPGTSGVGTSGVGTSGSTNSGSSGSDAGSSADGPVGPPVTTVARAPLTVLNNSRIHGLAHQAAARFEAVGWQIRLIGNLTGRIPVTTVYYDQGDAVAARELAKEFPQVQAVLPRFIGLPGRGLTIVLTEDWH